jgi:hypothetical protein
MSILYIGCQKFPTNWFVLNLCIYKNEKNTNLLKQKKTKKKKKRKRKKKERKKEKKAKSFKKTK